MTKESIIHNLSKCYELQDALIKRKIQVPEDLANEILEYEEKAFDALRNTISPNEIHTSTWIPLNQSNSNLAIGRNLCVKFPDGTIIREQKSVLTFIKTLQHIGLSKIPVVGITFQGYCLVDSQKRKDNGYQWQKRVDDWWVYTYLNNKVKVNSLLQIDEYYQLGISVFAVDKESEEV